MTDRGAGTGTAGPIISVRWTPLSIGHPRDAFRQRDAQPAADGFGQFVGTHRAVGVTDPPELLGVVEIPRGDVVQPLALLDHMLLQQRVALRPRHETAPQVDDAV